MAVEHQRADPFAGMRTWEITLFTPAGMSSHIEAAGFSIEQALEREPYPQVEYQSRRGYILAVREPGVIEESL